MKQREFRYCPTCNTKLQKRELTANSKQRWKCIHCSKSTIKLRVDLIKAFILDRFVAWLLGKQSQIELKSSFTDRTWRNQTAWCWDIIPKPELTGEVYEIILIDGIRVGSLVCLIARTPTAVIDWLWVSYESSNNWNTIS